MSKEILKKPVHLALLRPTQLEKMAAQGKISITPFGLDPKVEEVPLPVEQKEKSTHKFEIPKMPNLTKAAKKQVHLKLLHDKIPPIPEDKKPPCSSCKTAACCKVFVVNITELEYDSGVYGDAAIKIDPATFKQLRGRVLMLQLLTAPRPRKDDKPTYFLEGKMGEPCPFLTKDNKCGIYDMRPKTCRVYSCVGDPRITEEMRQGTVDLDPANILPIINNLNLRKNE